MIKYEQVDIIYLKISAVSLFSSSLPSLSSLIPYYPPSLRPYYASKPAPRQEDAVNVGQTARKRTAQWLPRVFLLYCLTHWAALTELKQQLRAGGSERMKASRRDDHGRTPTLPFVGTFFYILFFWYVISQKNYKYDNLLLDVIFCNKYDSFGTFLIKILYLCFLCKQPYTLTLIICQHFKPWVVAAPSSSSTWLVLQCSKIYLINDQQQQQHQNRTKIDQDWRIKSIKTRLGKIGYSDCCMIVTLPKRQTQTV